MKIKSALIVQGGRGGHEPDEISRILGNVLEAVSCGTGVAGLHGGMCDSFRKETEYHYLTGGQFVAHPGTPFGEATFVTYTIHIVDPEHPLTRGIKDFTVTSEQYYMHVDPANFILTTTNSGDVVMPVSWIKTWGKGRVFYSSLGHTVEDVRQIEAQELMKRGMLWAAEKQV